MASAKNCILTGQNGGRVSPQAPTLIKQLAELLTGFSADSELDKIYLAGLLAETGFVDADFYFYSYPEVKAQGMSACQHFLETGFKERKQPGAWLARELLEDFYSRHPDIDTFCDYAARLHTYFLHKSDKPDLLIYAYADKQYYKFVAPFIKFALVHNPLATVEIILEDKNYFLTKYSAQLNALRKYHSSIYFSQSIPSQNVRKNSIRFIQQPELHAEYVYITDIDILIMDDILNLHLPHMQKEGMFYSNIIRKNYSPGLMSGLHFIEYDKYFPVDITGLPIDGNDELLLYLIMEKRHKNDLRRDYAYRPVPGVHLSLNRHAHSNSSDILWECDPGYQNRFLDLLQRKDFSLLYATLDIEMRHLLLLTEYIYKGQFATAHFYSLMFGLDPGLLAPHCLKHEKYAGTKQQLTAEALTELSESCVKYILNPFDKKTVFSLLFYAHKHGDEKFVAAFLEAFVGVHPEAKKHLAQFSAKQEIKPQDHSSLQSIFTDIYAKSLLGGGESVSGPGSSLARTESVRKQLPHFLTQYKIGTLLDAPCGDLNWMATLLPQLPINYIGMDIVEALIQANKEKFKAHNATFVSGDITSHDLSVFKADLLLTRHCLFHFSYDLIKKFFLNFIKSGIPLLLTTSHVNHGFLNTDIRDGGWRWLDLRLPPFSLVKPLATIEDGEQFNLCLWSIEQIAGSKFLT